MRRGASGARRIRVYLRMERGRYQDGPTAVPRSSLTPDWKGEPHADDSSSIAPPHEGYVLQRSRVCEDRVPAPTTVVAQAGGLQARRSGVAEALRDIRQMDVAAAPCAQLAVVAGAGHDSADRCPVRHVAPRVAGRERRLAG